MASDVQASTIRERLARRRRRRLLRQGAIVALLLLLVALGAYRLYSDGRYRTTMGTAEPRAHTVHILLMGVEGGELQAAALVTVDSARGRATVLSLPAATSVSAGEDSEEEPRSLSAAYASGGAPALETAVEGLVGVPVDHRVEVDFSGFARLVDRLGGVPVRVRTPIVYRDAEGRETFRLDPGEHRLDGRAAVLYLRYRGEDWQGEVPRASRHREFVQAFARTAVEQAGLDTLPEWVEWVRSHVKTDLSALQMLGLAQAAWRAGPESVEFLLLPGRAVDGVWVLDEPALRRIMGRNFQAGSQGTRTP